MNLEKENIDNYKKISGVESVLLYGDLKENKDTIFSVVIPTYNRKRLLKETLESVINQKNFSEYEIIVVDNNDDFNDLEVKKIVEGYNNKKIYYYKNKKNIGATGNWNRCIELARSKWIVMIHDDDVMLENALEKINKIKNENNCNMIHFQYTTKNLVKGKIEDNTKGKIKLEKITEERFLSDPQVLAPVATAFEKKCALDIGGFDDSFSPSIDYEFWLRYIGKYSGIYVKNSPIAVYRIEDNDSLKKSTIINTILLDYKIIKKLENKYKFQYRLSYYNLLWSIYKKKTLSNEEKKEIMEKLGYERKKIIIAFLLRKLRIIRLWKRYQNKNLEI